MNDLFDLVEILKNVEEGTKLYSPVYGEIKFDGFSDNVKGLIRCKKGDSEHFFFADGRINKEGEECLLFPSKDNRDWNSMKPKKPRFDTFTLQPFDKVLWRKREDDLWLPGFVQEVVRWCDIFVIGQNYCRFVVPYNDDTKDIANTSNEAPEFYQYWMRYFE